MKKLQRELKREFPFARIETANSSHLRIVLPNDEVVPQSVNQGSPFVITHPNSTASQALKKLATNIVDEFAGRKPEPEVNLPPTEDGANEKGGSGFKKLFGR